MNDQNQLNFPILVVADDGWVALETDAKALSKWNYIGINKYNKREVLLFDSADNLWLLNKIVPAKPMTSLRFLLAKTFYNPTVSVSLRLENIKVKPIEKIIAAINKAIDIDDDILTQYADAIDLKWEIRSKSSFKDIVSVLKEKRAI